MSHSKYCKQCGAKWGQCKDKNVCKHFKLFPTLEKFGFNKSLIGTELVINEFYRIKNIIENLYKNRISENELKEIYNYHSGMSNFHKILKSLGIKTFSCKEANKINYELGKLGKQIINYQQYKCGWHTTWNGKEVYLRSSYELDYARELDEQKIDYEVEYFKIKYWNNEKQEYCCSIPDFYIPSTNTIVEIKSNFTLRLQEMKDKFIAYKKLGYNTKLICEHKEMPL